MHYSIYIPYLTFKPKLLPDIESKFHKLVLAKHNMVVPDISDIKCFSISYSSSSCLANRPTLILANHSTQNCFDSVCKIALLVFTYR